MTLSHLFLEDRLHHFHCILFTNATEKGSSTEERTLFLSFDGRRVKRIAAMFLNYFWDTNRRHRIRQLVQWKPTGHHLLEILFHLKWVTRQQCSVHWSRVFRESSSCLGSSACCNFPEQANSYHLMLPLLPQQLKHQLSWISLPFKANNVLLTVRHACLAFRNPARQLFCFCQTLNWLQKIKCNICWRSSNTELGRLYN